MVCMDGPVLVCDLGTHSCSSVSCNSSPCSACSFMPFECRSGCMCAVPRTACKRMPTAALAVCVNFCPMYDACAFQRAFLHLHVSSRVWVSSCTSESGVLPRLSATQNHAWPFHPVTQTQSPCALLQYSTCMIDAISCECIQDARVLRRARLAIPSPTLAVCVDLVTRDSGSCM